MKTNDVKRALDAVPPFAWLAIAAGVVALYLAKRASDAAGKGIDAVGKGIDAIGEGLGKLLPGPKIANANEIKFDYEGATYFVRRDGRGPLVFSVSAENPFRRNWILTIDGETIEGGSIDYAPSMGRLKLTDFPRLATSRYEFFVANAEGLDPVRIFDFTGQIRLGED